MVRCIPEGFGYPFCQVLAVYKIVVVPTALPLYGILWLWARIFKKKSWKYFSMKWHDHHHTTTYFLYVHSGPEKLKKSRSKFHEKLFLTKFHFLQSQKWPKINFWTLKKFKTAKNAISHKIFFDLFDFTSFFLPGLF